MNIFYITCKNKAEAKKISRKLLDKKLIACSNIFPIESMYRWKKKLQNDKEVALLLKTKEGFNTIKKEVKKLHSYEIPFIGMIKVKVNKEYLKWLKE